MKDAIKRLLCRIPPIGKQLERLRLLQAETEAQRQTIATLEQENAGKDALLRQQQGRVQQLEAGLSVWSRFFFHALPERPPCDYGFALGEAITRDENLVARIAHIAAAPSVERSGKKYVWDVIADAHGAYAAGLDHERLSLLAAAPLTNGLLQGDAMTARLRDNEQQRAHWANVALDALLSLCEAMELISVEDVELGVRCKVDRDTPERLLDAVSRLVGFEVYAPDVFTDLFGIKTTRGVFTFRHFIALYAAWRIATRFHDKDVRIAEIGAGAGLAAYYARRFGFRDYTIFDLPTVNIVQSWFLGQSLPETPLILADETAPFSQKGFRVLPPEFLGKAPDGFWDVAVNIDSIPEIDEITTQCNMRCRLCAHGHRGIFQRKSGSMTLDLFSKILDKIQEESPSARILPYHYCELLLHPEFLQFTDVIRKRGFRSSVASNFNYVKDIGEFVASGPDELVIGLSGFTNETYQRAHYGGDIENLKKNLIELRKEMDRQRSSLQVFIFYHMYKYNLGEEFDNMRRFVENIGFNFGRNWARSIMLELSMLHLLRKHKDFSGLKWFDDLADIPETFLASYEQLAYLPEVSDTVDVDIRECPYDKFFTHIKHDGAVNLCLCAFDDRLIAHRNFLEASPESIKRERRNHPLCKKCLQYRFYLYVCYADTDLINNFSLNNIAENIAVDRKM